MRGLPLRGRCLQTGKHHSARNTNSPCRAHALVSSNLKRKETLRENDFIIGLPGLSGRPTCRRCAVAWAVIPIPIRCARHFISGRCGARLCGASLQPQDGHGTRNGYRHYPSPGVSRTFLRGITRAKESLFYSFPITRARVIWSHHPHGVIARKFEPCCSS
jgi:hypothetical protein